MSKVTKALVCGQWVDAPDGDYFVTCSFDKSHVILRSKMPYHIQKCLKQHPNHNKEQCPYDATEYIDRDDFEKHILTCDSMQIVNRERYETALLKSRGEMTNIKPTPYFYNLPECDEDWGAEPEPQDFPRIQRIGRGVSISTEKKSPPATKKMGRGELMKRCIEQSIARRNSQKSCPNYSLSPYNMERCKSVDGQFED